MLCVACVRVASVPLQHDIYDGQRLLLQQFSLSQSSNSPCSCSDASPIDLSESHVSNSKYRRKQFFVLPVVAIPHSLETNVLFASVGSRRIQTLTRTCRHVCQRLGANRAQPRHLGIHFKLHARARVELNLILKRMIVRACMRTRALLP